MSVVSVFLALLLAGLMLSTVVFAVSQRLGSNDPFAIELACWWIFTDLVVMSKLRGWKLDSAIWFVRDNPDVALSGLVAVGVVVVLAAVLLSLTETDGRFRILDGWARQGFARFAVRSNLSRSIVSLYCSLHLALFLA
jgi:hypothetical protein